MINTALNLTGSGSPMKTSTPSTLGVQPFKVPPPAPPVHASAPSGSVASHTTTDSGGNTTTIKYNKPDSVGTTSGLLSNKVAGTSSTVPPATLTPQTNNIPATPIPPQSTFQQATAGLLNTGQGQNNNPVVNQAQSGLIGIGNKAQDIASDFGKQYSDAGIAGANASAGYRSTGTAPVGEGNANIIAQTTSAKQQAISAGEQEALQGLNQQSSGYQNAANLGQTQQSQNIGALGSVAGLTAPRSAGSGYVQIDPTTGQAINPSGAATAAQQGAVIEANANAAGTNAQNYQAGLVKLRAANNIEPQIVATLKANPTLNLTPISAITNLNQWLSGQTSDPAQQQLSSQIASYINALGLSPDQAAAIATQKGGTIGTLLKTLRDNFTAQNEGNNPANMNTGGSSALNPTSQSILDKYGIK